MAHEIYQDIDSNIAGFEWVWTFTVDRKKNGFELTVRRTDNDSPRRPYVVTRGRISTGAELLEELQDVCRSEDIHISDEDLAGIGKRLFAVSEPLAVDFVRAISNQAEEELDEW